MVENKPKKSQRNIRGKIPTTTPPVYELVNATKTVADGNREKAILDALNIKIEKGDFCGVLGKSGAGKSTLLNILGGLDVLSSGHISYMGKPLNLRTRREMSLFRRKVGFVFQSYQLIPHFKVFENVAMPLIISGMPEEHIRQKVLYALHATNFISLPLVFSTERMKQIREKEPQLAQTIFTYGKKVGQDFLLDLDLLSDEARVEISDPIYDRLLNAVSSISLDTSKRSQSRLSQYPKTLSGGEQQRVAIARAIVNDPDVILADEPTGSLDTYNESIILNLLQKLHQQKSDLAIVAVSHSDTIASNCSRIIRLTDGKVTEDKPSDEKADQTHSGEQI